MFNWTMSVLDIYLHRCAGSNDMYIFYMYILYIYISNKKNKIKHGQDLNT